MATDDFRTVAFEAPFPEFNRLNDYILGGEGDPRAILLGNRELGYWMWATEEVVDLVEWMRAYNANRGDKPPLEITGFDVADPKGSADLVLAYLNSADPVAAANASATYTACVPQFSLSDCQSRLNAVRDDLQNREDDLASRSSQRAFDVALQAASIVAAWPTQPNPYFAWRDDNMATNVERLQERRSSNGRIILWGHQEHLGKTINLQGSKPTGAFLAEHYGANYFVVGSSAGDGRFNVVDPNVFVTTARFPPMTSDDFESDFRSAAQPLLLIPLRGIALPQWLSSTRHLRVGSSNAAMDAGENLAQKLDAIVYVDQTSRTESFW
jgi:erythromycin esterase